MGCRECGEGVLMLMKTKICEECGIEFEKQATMSNSYWERRKYCSRACGLIHTGIRKGEPLPDEWTVKMKGRVSPRKGKPSKQSGEKHYNWKGGEVEKMSSMSIIIFCLPKS